MRWEDERYVRVYVRDTADWLALSWDAQALLLQLLRKANRVGVISLGRHGKRAVAVLLGQVALWESRLAPALDELLADGVISIDEGSTELRFRNYVDAQEAKASDKFRAKEYRERQNVTQRDAGNTGRDASVTGNEVASHAVTPRHTPSPLAVPSLAVPSQEKQLAQGAAEKAPQPPAPPAVPASPLVEFLTAEWPDVDRAKAEALEARGRKACPGVDLLVEAQKAAGWEKSDPRRRKVKHARFVWDWWSRSQDRGGKSPPLPGRPGGGFLGATEPRSNVPSADATEAERRRKREEFERQRQAEGGRKSPADVRELVQGVLRNTATEPERGNAA